MKRCKFKVGDEVIVREALNNFNKRYPYKVGYVFIIGTIEREMISEVGDLEWYTEEECLTKATKLDKALK